MSKTSRSGKITITFEDSEVNTRVSIKKDNSVIPAEVDVCSILIGSIAAQVEQMLKKDPNADTIAEDMDTAMHMSLFKALDSSDDTTISNLMLWGSFLDEMEEEDDEPEEEASESKQDEASKPSVDVCGEIRKALDAQAEYEEREKKALELADRLKELLDILSD